MISLKEINYHCATTFRKLRSAACSVGVVGDVGAASVSFATGVGALSGSAVGLSSLEEGGLSSLLVLGLTLPGLEDGLLESTTV